MRKILSILLIAYFFITCTKSGNIDKQDELVMAASKGGPSIKDQQCSVVPLTDPFSISNRLYVANRSNVVTGYHGISTNSSGFLIGAPDYSLGGTLTQLSIVLKNYLVGMVRDINGRVYIAGPNTGTVTGQQTVPEL